jgi:hypothetical protein
VGLFLVFALRARAPAAPTAGEAYLRTGIYGLVSGHCGTVGIPLNAATAAQLSKQ